MRVRFWGVRGSLPSPQLPSHIKSKISAILERLSPEDLESPESRERFLSDLPPWLFGTVGGNYPCVSVEVEDTMLIFDAGSGIRELGLALEKEKPGRRDLHLFFSHFHWDHIMGLPFFIPAYNPNIKLDFYSPKEEMEAVLNGQMCAPCFPIKMEVMGSKKEFHTLRGGSIQLPGCRIFYRKMNHPGDSYSYKIDTGKSCFIYSTDTELIASDFIKNEENIAFYTGADLLVMDSQYTLGEAIDKYSWGHSAFSMAVDFAANWNIPHMVLFHHDPGYDDHKLYNNLQSAKWYTERMNIKGLKLSLATEGLEIIV